MTRSVHRSVVLGSSLFWAVIALTSCAPAKPMPSVKQLIERHIVARGGREALSAIKTRRLTFEETSSNGKTIEEIVSTKAPNKELVVNREQGGPELFRTVFDGLLGYASLGGERKFLAPQELTQLGVDSEMFPELRFDLLFPSAKVIGRPIFHGRPVFRVDAMSTAGYEERFFFDTQNGLMIGVEFPRARSSHFLEEFEDYDGVKYSRTFQNEINGIPSTQRLISIEHNLSLDDELFSMR